MSLLNSTTSETDQFCRALTSALTTSSLCDPVQIASLNLSEEQLRVLLAMRRLYMQNMGALERRREELAALVVPVRGQINLNPNLITKFN